jgi:alpha-L-arabinofuranosidase
MVRCRIGASGHGQSKNEMKTPSFLPLKFVSLALAAACAAAVPAMADSISVQVDQPGIKISPTFYGLMTEEINHSYDGGLYAELIQNRVFKEFPRRGRTPNAWSVVQGDGAAATMSVVTDEPLNTNLQNSLKVEVTTASDSMRAGVANSGYWGIPVKPDTRYHASFYAKAAAGFDGPVTVSIESRDGTTVYAKGTVRRLSGDWKQYEATLVTGKVEPTTDARFVLSVNKPGTVWLNLVSLFPPTYHNTKNGNRVDLMELLAGMKPSFLRLPGGNYVEGNNIAERYDWKKTIGDLTERPGHPGTWNYRSSDGLGLLEYLEWCEDLKMEPVLAVWAGYALNGEHINPGPALEPYVQEALEEIEYVTGDTSTKWGAVRARDGHRAPFKLTYVEIGNEDFFDRSRSYDGRYAQFYDAIKAKYPNLQLIATTPVQSRTPDVVDDHYYRSARAMEADMHHYDNSDRNGPKIFVGEWASTEGSPTPTMNAALGDAAWMIGMEKNSDLVVMEAYAPLLVNVNPGARQWATDLIGYDALHSFGSPSYYAQAMFAQGHGANILPVEVSATADTAAPPYVPKGAIGVGTWSTQSEYKDIKVTHDGATVFQSDFSSGMQGWNVHSGEWSVHDGALAQTGDATDCRITAGDPSWTDYTYELSARKTGGMEGFLVLVHVKDANNYVWFNVGGWNNTRTVMEKAENGAKGELGQASDLTVENNRWYAIKIEVQGRDIKCYVDGKLTCQATDNPGATADPVYANATKDANGDVYLHVVNVTDAPRQVDFKINGATKISSTASCTVLSGDAGDVNSIAEPEKVAPKTSEITGVGASFTHELPAHSVSVIKLNAK